MRLLVNHLTRMRPGYICVAGIDLASTSHVRPVLAGGLGIGLLTRNGGPFGIGRVVELGSIRYAGHAPEVEDYRFDPARASCSHVLDPAACWEILQRVSRPALVDIFGGSLEKRGRSCTTEVGTGIASLGCLTLSIRPALYIDGYDSIRIAVSDGMYVVNLSVTDLRLYENDHKTPRRTLVERVARRIREGESIILSVGLTRPFMKTGDRVKRHWLQVNNIHLENDPMWDEHLK